MLDLKDIPSITIAPAGQALAAKLVTESELLRLKAIAHLHARGLPPAISWSDMLQEAFTRVLDGSRRRPPELPMVNFVAGILRSLRSEYWQKARREAEQAPRTAPWDVAAPDPERCIAAVQELAAIQTLFADDKPVQDLIVGLAEQRSPQEICAGTGMSKTEYDSARKRMRRALLREGLRWKER